MNAWIARSRRQPRRGLRGRRAVELEQRLLKQVHVLVLVGLRTRGTAPGRRQAHRDRARRARSRRRAGPRSRRGRWPPSAARGRGRRAAHGLAGIGASVLAEAVEVRLRRQPPVLRPLHLRREVDGGRELVRHRQRADPAQRQRLRRRADASLLIFPKKEAARARPSGTSRRGRAPRRAERAERAYLRPCR